MCTFERERYEFNMKFYEELNHYMELLDCSPKDICEISGLSPTIISRYLNTKRIPRVKSEYFDKIVESLYIIADKKNIKLSKYSIFETLKNSITFNDIDYDDFINNFNILQTELKISTVDFAKFLGYDTSFISRIKNKTRKPSDLENFIDKISDYITATYKSEEKKKLVSYLLNCSLNDLQDATNYKDTFINWITTSHTDNKKNIQDFLTKLDNFNLNDYIGTDFNKVKVPTSPVILRNSKTFYGIEGRKQAESEFLKTTLLSKSKEPIFFYSDLPITKAGQDEEFKQRWVLAMTMLLKKGLHLNIIHDVDRPIHEMFLGLENWIPIYMTGSISPYYFTNPPSNFFLGCHCTSGSVALSSECMKNTEENSRFYVTTRKEDLKFYKEKSKYMLSKAKPLMTIFKENNKEKFEEFMKKDENSNIKKVKKDIFKNIDFYINNDKWVMINKKISPEIHFVIYNYKLRSAIETFLME